MWWRDRHRAPGGQAPARESRLDVLVAEHVFAWRQRQPGEAEVWRLREPGFLNRAATSKLLGGGGAAAPSYP